MPGVPTGRGCDACRKQKKKCDQAAPSCARCTRLSIPCVGAGQQRYKFIHRSSPSHSRRPSSSTDPPGSMTLVFGGEWPTSVSPQPVPTPDPLSVVPSSQTSLIARSMISRLEVQDLRFELRVFGSFLRFVPARIGHNKALDAATDAFATSFANMHRGHNQLTTYPKHGEALRALREALSGSPVKSADVSDTMCAIYLTMITAGLLSGTSGPHAEGLAILLESTVSRQWSEPFEVEMLTIMVFSTLMECVSNDRLQTHTWLPRLLDRLEPLTPSIVGSQRQPYEPESPHPSSMTLRQMARLVEQLREPLHHKEALERHYAFLLADRIKVIEKVEILLAQQIHPSVLLTDRTNLKIMTIYGGLLSMAMAINGLLQQFSPDDTILQQTAEILVQDCFSVGERAICLRPLGATHAQPALSVAYALTRDRGQRMYAEYILKRLNESELEEDMFNEINMVHMREARWWKRKFHKTRLEVDDYYGRTPPDVSEDALEWHDPECAFQ